MARMPARAKPLERHQLIVFTSACNSNVPAEAAAAAGPYNLAAEYGTSWAAGTPGQLIVQLPAHPDFPQLAEDGASDRTVKLGIAKGGKLGWVLGEGRVSNWYDHPLEITVEPKVDPSEPDGPVETRHMLVVRPRKEPMQMDYVHTITFRRAYPGGEAELVYEHPRWVK